MNQIVTTGIMLARTNFGEADRIITILTPDYGKIKVMARGVRKVKSKLAGGVELFSVSNITFLKGKKDIGTLISTRLQTHFSNIVQDIDRTMIGYEILKNLNKITEDEAEDSYYILLLHALTSLNNLELRQELTRVWFTAQLLQINGHTPNTHATVSGEKLDPKSRYQFDIQAMGFVAHNQGTYTANHIKVMRLLLSEEPATINIIKNIDTVLLEVDDLLRQALRTYLRQL